MRLLFLNHNFVNSGTFYRAMPMAEQLAQRGHQVTLFCVSRTNRWQVYKHDVNGVNLIEGPNFALGGTAEGYAPLDCAARYVHAFRYPYDIVHCFDHKPNATFSAWPARWRGARIIADWADWWSGAGGVNHTASRWVSAFESWWEQRSKLSADGVTVISTVLAERARAIGCDPGRLIYLPTGAALERIVPMSLDEARTALGIPVERQIVGFIGMGQGDLDGVMRALQVLPEVHLMVIGRRTQHVTRMAADYAIAQRVWQTDFIPDALVGTYLASANVMILPLQDCAADRGRLPNKFLDYMCAARPTLSNSVGDTGRIIEKYGVGVLFNPGELSQMLGDLLSNPARCAEIGQRARLTAETHFAWPALIDQLEAFYTRIMSDKR